MEDNKREKNNNQAKRGLWKPEEDLILKNYVETHGEGNWAAVSENSGLMRGGKSCRLRWKNYLRPNIKRGCMSQEEEDLIIRMHKLLGNRWSLIAGRLPGRTDNEVKNYWNTHLNKKLCRSGKRKGIEFDDESGRQEQEQEQEQEQGENDDDEYNKKLRRFCDSHQPICNATEDQLDINEVEENKEKIMRYSTSDHSSWKYEMERGGGMVFPGDYNHDATFVFDDEPFVTCLDSFLLFEALEMQSIMHGHSTP
ncbi:hypothetical protein LWI28_019628 [Acer negundo]|uniref:Uncharacterized protein n=1 Tax=Acer negundo TaxID=4023 RepID=A0AAD5JAD0_ACENE|nr:hypothetical protein LWI28_019628 [Acer negundo]KAK4853181.1 hypothetical protein QYF36_004978 [Acer negundo]